MKVNDAPTHPIQDGTLPNFILFYFLMKPSIAIPSIFIFILKIEILIN
jgi:hypothetical protein